MSSENRLALALTGVFAALFGALLVLSVAVASDQQLSLPDYEPVNVAVEAARWELLAKQYLTEERKAIAAESARWHAIAGKYLTEEAIARAVTEETIQEEAIQSVESEVMDVTEYINYYFGGEGTTAEEPSCVDSSGASIC